MVAATATGKPSQRVRRVGKSRVGKKKVIKKRAGAKLATVSMVKKMIHRNMENKLAGTNYEVQFNNLVNSPADAYGLLPSILQGTSDNERIGNRITPRGLLVTAQVYITPDAGLPAGTVLLPRIMVLQQKSQSGFQPGLSVDFGHLLDWGQGEHSFTGTLSDYRAPINTDSFHVYKDIKARLSLGSVEQNSLVCSKIYKFWIPCPKTLLYDDLQNYPQNFAPFICMGFAEGQGVVTPPDSRFVTMSWTSTLYYEDA